MFDGESSITLTKEGAKTMLSKVLTDLFGTELVVTDICDDYHGFRMDFATPEYVKEQVEEKERKQAALDVARAKMEEREEKAKES